MANIYENFHWFLDCPGHMCFGFVISLLLAPCVFPHIPPPLYPVSHHLSSHLPTPLISFPPAINPLSSSDEADLLAELDQLTRAAEQSEADALVASLPSAPSHRPLPVAVAVTAAAQPTLNAVRILFETTRHRSDSSRPHPICPHPSRRDSV